MWGGAYFWGISYPQLQGGGATAFPNIFRVPSIYAYTLCRRTTTRFDVVTHMAGDFLGVSHASNLRGRSPSVLQFGGFSSIYVYIPFNAERPNSAW